MVDTGIFCTTAEVQNKVGANASATSNVEAFINQYVSQAESYINVVCKYNFSDTYAALNADVKKILTKWAASLAAIDVINYDLSGTSRLLELQTRMDVLNDEAQSCEKLLTDDAQDHINWINSE